MARSLEATPKTIWLDAVLTYTMTYVFDPPDWTRVPWLALVTETGRGQRQGKRLLLAAPPASGGALGVTATCCPLLPTEGASAPVAGQRTVAPLATVGSSATRSASDLGTRRWLAELDVSAG